MTTMAGHIAARLVQDTTIASICSTRVFDHDIRLDGPDAHPEIRGPYGFLLPHIVVDDSGGLSPAPLGPSGAFIDRLRVWLFAESSSSGRTSIEQLTTRVLVRLHRWREDNTRAQMFFADRTGWVADPPPGTGGMDVLTFAVSGTFVGVST